MNSRPEKLKQSLESAVKGMSSEQLNWHPPGKWCAAEVLKHLYLTYTGTINGLESVMTSGKPFATRASLGQRVLTFVVVGLGHMPAGRKPQWSCRRACRRGRCETRLGQNSWRWMRSSRSVKPGSGVR